MLQNQEKKAVDELAKSLLSGGAALNCVGVCGAADAYITWRIHRAAGMPVVLAVPDSSEAARLVDDLRFFAGREAFDDIALFPSYDLASFRSVSYNIRTAGERIALLYRISQGLLPSVTVVPVDSLMQRLVPTEELTGFAMSIDEGQEIDRDALVARLVAGGYERTPVVEEVGDFSVRGSIIDLFSPFHEQPVRIDFMGDTVESINFFSPVTQRRSRQTNSILVLPAREVVIEKKSMGRIISSVKKRAGALGLPVSASREIIRKMEQNEWIDGIENLMPLIYPSTSTFFDYLPSDTCLVFLQPENMRHAAETKAARALENYNSAKEDGKLCVGPDDLYISWQDVADSVRERPLLMFSMLADASLEQMLGRRVLSRRINVFDNTSTSAMLHVGKNDGNRAIAPLLSWIKDNRHAGAASVVVCGSRARQERVEKLFELNDFKVVTVDDFTGLKNSGSAVYVVPGAVSSGFNFYDERIAIISDAEIFGTPLKRHKKKEKSLRDECLDLDTLRQGDLVVHVDHGIGRYEGIEKIKVDGVTNDFLLITYRDGDRLYLSVDRMDLARKYVGAGDIAPPLDKMGGKSWARTKARAKKEVEKIAKELLSLYARRKVSQGRSFTPPEEWLRDFEAGFPFEETEDQRRVIEEVLSDMQSSVPMDRLVCGDVGYGKTEIAMRASFVCVSEGMQVAVLVPTTVLAEQHFATFSERFSGFPVNIAALSRFRSVREQKKIVADLKEGRLDIVIGTHRLLSKDVQFKELGLVVLDEEQRFGVRHKEALKKLRTTVDVLSLTATPIPRTLHMSLMGVRDISVITTPPERRRSIKTYICEFDDAIIRTAVRKELERGGQIFFVHNNIHKIHFIANHIQKLVPEARLGIAHGRMTPESLENEMMRFVNREIDMLVCTRIIESGIDIPSANTIFINRADMFGLAQLYQLRGRVGRADEQAYAYLFIPKESALGRDAQKRLKVLMEHSDLGSGFQIAMNDLKIRGGGSALGVSQSGHISAIGYDMFLQLMEQAVAELKGEPIPEPLNPEINIPVSCFLPETYLPDVDQRMSIYRRLSKVTDIKSLSDIKDELTDRFGPMPQEAENLVLKIMLRIYAIKAGVSRLDATETAIRLMFSATHITRPEVIIEMAREHSDTMELLPGDGLKVSIAAKNGRGAVVMSKKILKELVLRGTC